MASSFKENVILKVKQIPFGKVVSYGQVAVAIGYPRGARQVGWALNGLESICEKIDLPWWRVINNQGRITIKGCMYNDAMMQKTLLEAEGILVNEDFTLDINNYRYIYD